MEERQSKVVTFKTRTLLKCLGIRFLFVVLVIVSLCVIFLFPFSGTRHAGASCYFVTPLFVPVVTFCADSPCSPEAFADEKNWVVSRSEPSRRTMRMGDRHVNRREAGRALPDLIPSSF